MRVCVTGANGFVGRPLCQALLSNGCAVVPVVRRMSAPDDVAVGDIGVGTNWASVLQGCDVVVHLAARVHVMHDEEADPLAAFRKVNVEGALNLARQAAAAGVRRFVYLSSVKVNGEGTSSPICGSPLTPALPREGGGGCFLETDAPAPEDAYAISKHEAEQGLRAISRETGMEMVIIRPPLVYGPGVKGNFAAMVRWMRRGVPLPLGAVHNRRSLVALDNLINFIALCADADCSPRAANEVFLISDGEDVSTTELLHKVARAYGVMPRLVPVPARWMRFAAGLLGKGAVADRLLGSLVVDSSKVRELLGWRPVVSMDEQLKKMALYDSSI